MFNEHLNVVTWQLMPCGLITNLAFHDKGDQLIASGKEGCFLIDMDIKFSYDPVMAILLDPKGQSIEVSIKQPKKKEYELAIGKIDQDQGDGNATANFFGRDGLDDDGGIDGDPANDGIRPVNCMPREYGPHIKQLQGLAQWVNGLKVFEKDNLIVAWKKENSSDSAESYGSRGCRVKATKDQIMFYALSNQPRYQ